MTQAIDQVANGKNVGEVIKKWKVPRSTLYHKIKGKGILPKPPDLSLEMVQALSMVAEGKSLQRVAELTGIPKTVLWRRVKKSALDGSDPRLERFKEKPKSKYSPVDKAEAIEGLKRGESLCKLSVKFNVPKATLFREKVKLQPQPSEQKDNDCLLTAMVETGIAEPVTSQEKLEDNFVLD